MNTIKTVLHDEHRRLGARMTDFGGFTMPLQYTSIVKEHIAVRSSAGIFDISHMGEFRISGKEVVPFVDYLLPNRAGQLKVGKVLYSPMCSKNGGILDDLLVYRLAPDEYMLVVNAANINKDLKHIQDVSEGFEVDIEDISAQTGLLAIQGPRSAEILSPLSATALKEIPYFGFEEGRFAGQKVLISRTGYTGEDGFELYLESGRILEVWNRLLAGKDKELIPVGLGARNTLRLEAGLPLYGRELHEDLSPLAVGLEWTVDLRKESFIGRTALRKEQEVGVNTQLIGLRVLKTGVPRNGYQVHADGEQVGEVTSGTYSPVLETGIALALVKSRTAERKRPFSVDIRKKEVPAERVELPFVEGSVKRSK